MNSGYGAMSKSPQHPRDRGGVFTLKNPDDGSPIREQIVVGGRLLSITEKCVYGRLTDHALPTETVSADCLCFQPFFVARRNNVVALPRSLPQPLPRLAYFSGIIAKLLKGLVGAPGLEPGTR